MRRRPLVALLVAVVLTAGCGGGEADRATSGRTDADDPVAAESTTPPASDPGPGRSTVGTQPATLDDLPATDAAAVPVAVAIADIEVDAPVVAVGVAADGGMEVPSATDVGWYRYGPAPGAEGSSVLAAHVDYDGRQGAFFRLQDLEVGATVTVTMADGSEERFVVDELRQVPKADLSDSGVFDRGGPARLALITCGGEFDDDRRSYRDNVVALAAPAA